MQPIHPERALYASPEARRMSRLCGTALVLLALFLCRPVLRFGFLYLRDDDINVALNPNMGAVTASRLHWMFTNVAYVRRYIPLGWLDFSATYSLAGLDPAPYHAVGLGLYLLNTALVFGVLLRAVRLFGPRATPGGLGPWQVGAAALAAAWWSFSPMRVETTAWVSGNLYGQAAALLLLSLLAYMRSYTSASRLAWVGASAALYAASLLTYPIALGVPGLIVGLDWMRTRKDPRVPFRRLLAEKAAFLAPLAAMLAVTVAARVGSSATYGAVPGLGEMSLASRLAQSAYVAAYYVWKPWWPTHLSPLYDTLMVVRPLSAPFALSAAAAVAVSAAALWKRRSLPALPAVWFGYLACAAPFFGLTEKPHMASDRYDYFLAVIAAAVLAAALGSLAAHAARMAAAAAGLAFAAFFAVLTDHQLPIWAGDRVQHAYVAAHLTNAELRDDFMSRMEILEFMRGDERVSEQAVAERLARNPEGEGFWKAASIIVEKKRLSVYYRHASLLAIMHEQMGLKLAEKGELREANDHIELALRTDDRFYQAAFDRAIVLLGLGRPDDALNSYLIASRWASPPIPEDRRKGFLTGLLGEASAEANQKLAQAARAALAR